MAAHDAALQGLRTALLERGDFGSGTSHNSFKLMHGGMRHVQNLNLVQLRIDHPKHGVTYSTILRKSLVSSKKLH